MEEDYTTIKFYTPVKLFTEELIDALKENGYIVIKDGRFKRFGAYEKKEFLRKLFGINRNISAEELLEIIQLLII
ncbi:MAG: hypothetical protein FWF54_03345 [Candidatus Azobacteroides sp.]|nr:hypothetical protein [Candidatus Azobacteroides sp.]